MLNELNQHLDLHVGYMIQLRFLGLHHACRSKPPTNYTQSSNNSLGVRYNLDLDRSSS